MINGDVRILFDNNTKTETKEKEKTGGEGYRSPYLSHAKRALYHLSYTPFLLILSPTTLSSTHSTDHSTQILLMKIAFLHPDLGIGGAERLVVDAAVALKQKGHDVTV